MVQAAELLPFVTSLWFFLAAAVFRYKARTFRREILASTPIIAYLAGIGLFFLLQGYGGVTPHSCPGALSCTDFGGALVTMLAASFVARYPLQSVIPGRAEMVFGGLVVVSVVTSIALAVVRPTLVLRIAQLFAFVVAGLATVGYLTYRGLTSGPAFEWQLGVALAPCCVVAHGLAGFGLVAVVSLPLLGVPLQTPVLFATLAPVAVVGVLVFFARLDRAVAAAPDEEGDPAGGSFGEPWTTGSEMMETSEPDEEGD